MPLASDTFTRANEAPLAAPWFLETAVVNLHNQTAAIGGGSRSVANYTGVSFPNNQYAQVLSFNLPQYPAFDIQSGLQGLGPAVRVSYAPTIQAYYVAALRDRVVIVRQSNTTRTILASSFLPANTMPADSHIRLEVVGPSNFTELDVLVNGVNIVGATDTTGFATGLPGLFVGHVNTPVLLQVDAWKAGDSTEAYSTDYPLEPQPVIVTLPRYIKGGGRGAQIIHLP